MEMTINHGSHLLPQQVGQFQSEQRSGPGGNLGYTDSYSSIKYEPIDGIESQSVGGDFIGSGQHQMTLNSPKSFFNNDFFDLPENLPNAQMNGVIQSVSQDHSGLNKIAPQNRTSRSSDDQSSNGEAEMMVNGGGKIVDKRHVRGRASNLDRKRPYPCKVCPSKFGSKMELEEHQNSHTGQKPFECEVCNSRFNRRSTLWNHKRIHSDAKPFQCSVCNMQFKWKNSLKCHKEMHVRKNETTVAVDNEIRQLTYATAAKRRLLEMEGSDSTKTVSSMTIFSAASTSSDDSQQSKDPRNNYSMPMSSDQQYSQSRKRSKVKKETTDDGEILEGTMLLPDQQQLSQQLIENSILGNVAMDLNIDTQTNLDFMNNQLLMQAICSTDSDQSCNQNDLRSSHQQNCNSIFGMEDSSKMLPGSLLDIKDSLSLQSPVSNSATSINMLPFLKPIINVNVNVDFNQLGSLNDNPSTRQHQLPTISHFTSSSGTSDYGNDSLSNGHFHVCHTSGASTTSSSSTPSSNGHHRYGDMNYNQQSLDHSLLLTTQHGNNDYMNAFDYMVPTVTSTGNPNYSNVDIPLSALANDHNLISTDHNLISPHSTRMMIYHGIEHHPNCMSSQMSAGQLR